MESIQEKINYMMDFGFSIWKCSHRLMYVLDYKGYEWDFATIEKSTLSEIKEFCAKYKAEE